MTATFTIAWGSFIEVAAVSVLTALVAVGLFSAGVVAFARARPASTGGSTDGARNPGALGAAIVCFLAVAAIVVYGLYLVVHK